MIKTETHTKTKKGYKQTKLGWIPEDWSVKSLDELGEFSKGKGIAKKEIIENNIEGLPCIRYAEIYTKYHYNTVELKSKINQESSSKSNPINYGDLLFAGSGETLEDIGKSIAYLGKSTAYAGGDIIILKQKSQDSKFLGYLLNNDIVKSQLFKLGQGHSVVHIYPSGLKKVMIPIPPLPEQQKIAQILSTWDKAITTQEELITQKQQLKKGLMQQLLTGKKRLEGFEAKWKKLKLKDIAKVTMGQSPKSNSYNEIGQGIWLIQGNADIKKRKSSPRIFTSAPTKLCEIDDILMTVRAPVGKVAKSKHNACIGRGMCSIKPLEKSDFLYYKLLSFEKKWNKYEQGSTFSAVGSFDIKKLKLKIPVSIKEQQKIAEVLTVADTEIKNLEQQLLQLKTQKQGLMQQLLTGDIRV